ncbi:MAG: YdiU family protein [gamma proteobacterium symbiont of Bathyaustriella thionipta]|nr:YdiU family protein [gamma proteobacterium symbiont of Bathyaustriella thionipta]
MSTLEQLQFVNRFARLPEDFYARVDPDPLSDPHLLHCNAAVADLLGLDSCEVQRPQFAQYFGGLLKFRQAEPLAMLYAGHQFGHWVPQLGDGRAILLGEVQNQSGEVWDLQLKGAGQTPFSRDGDGRAVLRSSIREYLCSEAMHGLGIPTTRALCLVGGQDEVYREQIETAAMLLRVSPSHVRFGSFEVFYYRNQFRQLRQLADFVIQHHYAHLADSKTPYHDLLREVIERSARLLAQWQLAGFSHGVMNTDNMSILGLTLDYGPFGFLDNYEAGFICNHSDHHGRYAFDRQASVGLWNLSCLAQAFLPLLDEDNGEAAAEQAGALLDLYEPQWLDTYATGMRAKLGLQQKHEEDQQLSQSLLNILQLNQVDYTQFFRRLCDLDLNNPTRDTELRQLFNDPVDFDAWARSYRARLERENSQQHKRQKNMQPVNPKFILRNYLAQAAIEKAQRGDVSDIDALMQVLATPFDEHPEYEAFSQPPAQGSPRLVVSCSS